MSHPVDPHRGDARHQYGRQPQYAPPVSHGPSPLPAAPPAWRPDGPRPTAPPAWRPAAPPGPAIRGPRRIPGLGLVLALLGLVVQVFSLTVLPWARLDAGGLASASMPDIWRVTTEQGTHGFGGWYVVLFSYPLAALGVLLALASVLESMALKLIWGGLALVGLGVLVLRYGFGPFAELFATDARGLHFTTQEVTTAVIAVAALVVVIVVLRTAVTTFRRVAGLILLGLAGVHVAAVWDLASTAGAEHLSFGAYGPALGYLLTAIAAFAGPVRLAR